jgi:hypothetical protein
VPKKDRHCDGLFTRCNEDSTCTHIQFSHLSSPRICSPLGCDWFDVRLIASDTVALIFY